MSHKVNNEILENAWSDFNGFLQDKNFSECRAIQDNLGDLGYAEEAIKMHQMINSSMV